MRDSDAGRSSCFRPRFIANERRGLTMLEIVVSLVLVSTILLVSLQASARLLRSETQANESLEARELAGMLLDEITAMPFRDLDGGDTYGLETGEGTSNRTTFDDVDDFNGYSSTPPVHRDGTTMPRFTGWSVSVVVQPAVYDASGVLATTIVSDPLRLIVVQCTSPTGEITRQSGFVSDTPSDMPITTSHMKVLRTRLSFTGDRSVDIVVPFRNAPPPAY